MAKVETQLPAAARAQPTTYVPEVDAMRALALGLVILFHGRLVPFGWSGVWVFFVVSGFAITTSLIASRKRSGDRRWHIIYGFYGRRALRIWPLYYTFVFVNLAILLLLHIPGPIRDVPYLLTFTYNMKLIFTHYTHDLEWNPFGPLWTLAVEEQFYLLFPFMFVFLGKRSLTVALALLLGIAPLIRLTWSAWLVQRGLPDDRVALGVYAFAPAHFDSFAAGALIALNRDAISRRRDWARYVLAAAAFAIVLYTAYFAHLQSVRAGRFSVEAFRNLFSGIAFGDGREVWLYTLLWLVSAGLLMSILAGEQVVLRVCRLPGLQSLGRISFGGYIFNSSVFMLVGVFLPLSGATDALGILVRIIRTVCAIALITVAATLSYRLLEAPFLTARRKFG